jgi:hypothetical protein
MGMAMKLENPQPQSLDSHMAPAAAAIARMEWRRPIITDIPPPNGRPTAEKAAAGHRVLKRRYQRQRQRRAEENPSKPEDVRLAHLRWSELTRLMRDRYRTAAPDSLEGRRDIEIMFNYARLTDKKPSHIAQIWALWLDQDELDHMAAQRPVLHTADDLAEKLDLKYCDRQRLAIRTIGAVDCDQDERDRLRLERRNAVKRRNRAEPKQETSMKPREKVVLAAIGTTEIPAASVVEQVKKHRAFRDLTSARQEVHRILNRLLDMGLIVDRSEPRPQGMIRHVSRPQQPSRAALRR